MQRRTPKSTLTDTLFPYQTVFRSLCRLNSWTCSVLVSADANGPALLPEAVENLNPAARIGAAIGKPGIAIALQAQLFVQLVGERCSRLAAVGQIGRAHVWNSSHYCATRMPSSALKKKIQNQK